MAKPKLHESPKVLVVEGYDDLLFFAEVLEHLAIGDDVFIKSMGGKANLTTNLETFLAPLLAEKESIGVVVDADANPQGTVQSLETHLSKITGRTVRNGKWTDAKPRVGLYVVPGQGREGEIESLVWNAWASDAANAKPKACIEAFLACMKTSGHEAHSPDKGKLGALLSVRNDEDPRLGPGARARVFDLDRPELAELLTFLRGL